MLFIDPLKFQYSDLPIFVSSDDLRALLGWGIRVHTNGNYSHSMVVHNVGYFASQGLSGYREIPIVYFMKPRYRLKFWQITDLSKEEGNAIICAIEDDLNAPWWRKMYDFVGIFGQAIRLRGLNNPMSYYCSERTAKYLRMIPRFKKHIHPKSSPSELDTSYKKLEELGLMSLLGYWIGD